MQRSVAVVLCGTLLTAWLTVLSGRQLDGTTGARVAGSLGLTTPHFLAVSVADVRACSAWYARAFGLEVVADLPSAAVAELRQRGVTGIGSPQADTLTRSRWVLFQDGCGDYLQLLQRPAEG
jgi:hypothetical protein